VGSGGEGQAEREEGREVQGGDSPSP
jgi:hypothetical protein